MQVSSAAGRADAAAVLDAALAITRLIRTEIRRHRPARLSLSQFRALGFIGAHSGARLAELADYLGLSVPTTSRLVTQLVGRRMVTRTTDRTDRRRAPLRLTPAGRRALEQAFAAARAIVAERMATLAPAQRARVSATMTALTPLFAPTAPPRASR